MKTAFLNLAVILITLTSYSQREFNQSFGVSYITGFYRYEVSFDSPEYDANGFSGPTTAGFAGITWNPRYDFILSRERSFSLTGYPTIGATVSTGREGKHGILTGELPLVAQLNFGHHSTDKSEKRFGSFIGAGYSMGYYSGLNFLHGPTVQMGIKFALGQSSYGLRVFAIRPVFQVLERNVLLLGGSILYNLDRSPYKVRQ